MVENSQRPPVLINPEHVNVETICWLGFFFLLLLLFLFCFGFVQSQGTCRKRDFNWTTDGRDLGRAHGRRAGGSNPIPTTRIWGSDSRASEPPPTPTPSSINTTTARLSLVFFFCFFLIFIIIFIYSIITLFCFLNNRLFVVFISMSLRILVGLKSSGFLLLVLN